MPYIDQDRRPEVTPFSKSLAQTPGELNFQITQLALLYIAAQPKLSYTLINEVMGALECAKLELYRRLAAFYEDRKIAENGDVYPYYMVK
jgi:hypothetical protein